MARKVDSRTGAPHVRIGASIVATTLAVAWSALPIVENSAFAAPRALSTSKHALGTSRLLATCDPTPVCPPLDVVFILDTSGSMADEAAALCEDIAQVVSDWGALGITVKPWLLGITETPGGPFYCLADDVVTMLGGDVPAEPPSSCEFPGEISSYESWGAATAIVAEQFSSQNLWTEGAVRVIVPISDEGPCNGSFPDGCDETDDHESIANAIASAVGNDAIVSPITGTSSNACVIAHATALADGTGGIALQTEDPAADLTTAIYEILLETCAPPPCDDGDACTLNDRCIDGVCVGDAPEDLMVQCTGDGDCPGGWFCNDTDGDPMKGYCDCGPTPLCVEFDHVCYVEDDTIQARIIMGAGSANVFAGGFLMQYDPSCVEFVRMTSGRCVATDTGDPAVPTVLCDVDHECCPEDDPDCDDYRCDAAFQVPLDHWVDSDTGRIWYAAASSQGTDGPADIGYMSFRKLHSCDPCDICLISENPFNTLLAGSDGQPVSLKSCVCSEDIMLSPPVDLACPASVAVDADPGGPTAIVTWKPVAAVDGCAGPVDVLCTVTHSSGADITHLIDGGGKFPAGTADFRCEAKSASCGAATACQWAVDVHNQNCVQIDVQLSPPVVGGALERCIEFEFYSDCIGAPEAVHEVVTFGGPFNLPGMARDITLCIPPANYACATARDPLHTLRSVAPIETEGDMLVAGFVGDPGLGGNWLFGGNLNGNRLIDILDLAALRSQFGMSLNPNTTCDTPGPHSDINGDGIVDSDDESFVLMNYLMTDKETCCPEASASERAAPVTEISIRELRQMGLGHLGVADTNHDGILNAQDFAHPMPTPPKRMGNGRR